MFERIGLLLGSLALTLNIVGLAIPYWLYYSEYVRGFKIEAYTGLWRLCIEGSALGLSKTGCFAVDDFEGITGPFPSEFKLSRAVEIIATLLIAAALVLSSIRAFAKRESTCFSVLAAGLAVLAGVLMIFGAAMFVASDDVKKFIEPEVNLTPHAGFALCIVSGVLSFASATMFFIEYKQQ